MIPGPKILLMGPAGTGKTFALGTLCDWASTHNKTMFVLGLDQGLEALLGYYLDRGKELPACLHWRWLMAKPISLKQIEWAADLVGKFDYQALCQVRDSSRAEHNAFLDIVRACREPVSDRDGKKFPALDAWDNSMIFVIDGLTELSNAAMKMKIGAAPTADKPDYGVAQNNLMNLLRLYTQGSLYTFVLIAHVAREINEISGSTVTTVNTVGRAIAPEIPPMFSDVIYTVREGDKFFWDTAAFGVETKTRSLGYRSRIPPDFAQIMDKWVERGGC